MSILEHNNDVIRRHVDFMAAIFLWKIKKLPKINKGQEIDQTH